MSKQDFLNRAAVRLKMAPEKNNNKVELLNRAMISLHMSETVRESNMNQKDLINRATVRLHLTSIDRDPNDPHRIPQTGKGTCSGSVVILGKENCLPYDYEALCRGSTDTDFVAIIATAAHCLSSSLDVDVMFTGSQKKHKAKIIMLMPDQDVGLVALLEKPDINLIAFDLLSNKEIVEMTQSYVEVIAAGYPGHANVVNTTKGGIVARHEHIQTDAAINPGNSGGPLIANMQMIGTNVAKMHAFIAEATGYAVPVSQTRMLMESTKGYLAIAAKKENVSTLRFPCNGKCPLMYSRSLATINHKGALLLRAPALGVRFAQPLTADARKVFNVPDDVEGLVINEILPGGSAEGSELRAKMLVTDVQMGDRVFHVSNEGLVKPDTNSSLMLAPFLTNNVPPLPNGCDVVFHVYDLESGVRKQVPVKMNKPSTIVTEEVFEDYESWPYHDQWGLTFRPLVGNVISRGWNDTGVIDMLNSRDGLHKNWVIVTKTVGEGGIFKNSSVRAGLIVSTINGVPIKTLDDIVLATSQPLKGPSGTKYHSIVFLQDINEMYVIQVDTVETELQALQESFKTSFQ